MDLRVLCLFATILFVSAEPEPTRFDLGPQKFYETSSPAPRRDQNAAPKEVVLYLTPSQIKALEAGGAVVRPAEPENDSEEAPEEAQPEAEEQPEENTEQEQEQEQEQEEEQENNETEAEQPEEQEEAEQPEQEQEIDEELQGQDLALEEILRILNEERLEQEEVAAEQGRTEPQATEETSEEDNEEEQRLISPRFQGRQNQQRKTQQKQQPKQPREDKYLAPVAQTARSKVYATIRYNEQPQRTIVQFPRQQVETNEQPEQPQSEAPAEKRYKLVPYEVVEPAEEPAPAEEQPAQQDEQAQQEQEQQEEAQQSAEEANAEEQENEERLNALTPLVSSAKLAQLINRRRNKLSKNELELQAILRELKQSSKYNDQKYAIEIERLRTNLQKQNALAKAEALAKTAPQLIRKELLKRRPSQSAKLVKSTASVARKPVLKSQKQRAQKSQPVPVEVARPVPVPVVKSVKVEVPRPVPVEVEKRVPVPVTRNVYVKVNKPYLVERIVPVEIKKEIPVEIPIRKPQRLTILRHVWEH